MQMSCCSTLTSQSSSSSSPYNRSRKFFDDLLSRCCRPRRPPSSSSDGRPGPFLRRSLLPRLSLRFRKSSGMEKSFAMEALELDDTFPGGQKTGHWRSARHKLLPSPHLCQEQPGCPRADFPQYQPSLPAKIRPIFIPPQKLPSFPENSVDNPP